MTLHIFNPEYDLVLASAAGSFTPPKAVRALQADLGFLPALWAEEGDWVLVADVEAARQRLRHFKRPCKAVHLVDEEQLARLLRSSAATSDLRIEPWGWDRHLKARLADRGVAPALLPTDEWLAGVRRISSRVWAAEQLLPQLRRRLEDAAGRDAFTGRSFVVTSTDELSALLLRYPRLVVKAPWSSSGRGIRYIDGCPDISTLGWCANMISRQGSLTAEPYYRKVRDFGMEFSIDADGRVLYQGLSLFNTARRAYTGSLLAPESVKRALLARLVDVSLLDVVARELGGLLQECLAGRYVGCLGVDMMMVRTGDALAPLVLHPCVELNLRRTMGHVALSLSPSEFEPQQLMTIHRSGGSYHLRLQMLTDGLLNTSVVSG